MSDRIVIRIIGTPAPQGSKTAFNGRVVEGGSKTGRAKHRAWRNDVAWTAREAWAGQPPIDYPCHVELLFLLRRPSGTRKGALWQAKKPDIDKLIRSTLDGLTEGGVLVDDARVASLTARKMFAGVSDSWTGADVIISPLTS